MDDGLKQNDPYRKMSSGKSKIRPGFLGKSEKKSRPQKKIVRDLSRAEENALMGGVKQTGPGTSAIREGEEKAGGFYSGGSVFGRKTKKQKGKFTKKGPIVAILFSIFGIGGLMFGVQLFQPFSLVAQFTESFNSMHTSANLRSSSFLRMQLEPSGRVRDPIKGKIFGADTFKITDAQASKLKLQGIEYDNDFGGTGLRVLKYDDGTGEIRLVTADNATARRLTDMDLSVYNTEGMKYNSEAIAFNDLYDSDADFYNSYNSGSMTWRGAIANWFGTMTAKFLSNNKLTRNMFRDFRQKVADSETGNPRIVAQEIMAKNADEIEGGGVKRVDVEEPESEGGETTVRVEDEAGDGYRRGDIKTEAEVKSKLMSVANKYVGGASKVANVGCVVVNALGGISLLVSASEALQIINLTTAYFEVVDKTKAGYGEETPINELANALNDKTENTNYILASSGEPWDYGNQASNFTADGIKTLKTEKVTTNKTAMESSGISALYGGGAVDPNDPSAQSFNFTNSIKRVLGGVGTSMAAFETCALAKVAVNLGGAAIDALSIAGCIAGVLGAAVTFGVSAGVGCGALIANTVVGIATSVAIGVTMMAVVSAITPVAANMLTRDLISELGGEDLGNALTSGANMYLGNNHRANGGSLANYDKYVAYVMRHQDVIAENAKFERQNLNPLDLTSKYTFLGTIMTQMMSFMTNSSLMDAVKSGAGAVSSSIVAMSPTASAYNIVETLPNTEEYARTCPYLASIGAVGDAYCNPYSMTDVSTIGDDPLAVIEKLDEAGNFQDIETSDGNVKIAGNSDLAKYIMFCDQRESAFGIADQNIVNELSSWGQVKTQSSTINAVANSAIGAIPVVGDVIDIVGNSQSLRSVGYISGESCVAGNTVNAGDSPNWDKAKYYQRFIEDQALSESMGLIDKSAVTAFLDEYYNEHPLDNSYEGILARKSGLEKETVVALLDFIDYADYVANYDPASRYAFGESVISEEQKIVFDEHNEAPKYYAVAFDNIYYADVRNRNFAI